MPLHSPKKHQSKKILDKLNATIIANTEAQYHVKYTKNTLYWWAYFITLKLCFYGDKIG